MFYGRESDLNELLTLWNKRVSSLITCRGRRRIGKSTLIREFAKKSKARLIQLEGMRPRVGLSNEDELRHFSRMLAAQTAAENSLPENWLIAFKRLGEQIRDNERTVVLLDEISWMGHYDELFADTLKTAWELYFKPHDRLVVAACGSVSSWIKENIIDNGAFMGRRSGDFVLHELPLKDCVKFWGRAAETIDKGEILDVLSVTGGVPRYLEEIDPALSADDNIRRLGFLRKSVLREDFDEMFTDVIAAQPRFSGEVLRCLVDGPKTVSEVAAKLGVERGGNVSKAMVRLGEAGFVSPDHGKNPETGAEIRERRFRLSDNYARFYLKFIEPVKELIDNGGFAFTSLKALGGWNAVKGLAFENLVLNHYPEFAARLGLSTTLVKSAAPYVKRRSKETGEAGCQIDLLLQAENMMCLVEIKRQKSIGVEVIEEMEAKVSALGRKRGVTLRTALVYSGELDPEVAASGYFNAIVDVEEAM